MLPAHVVGNHARERDGNANSYGHAVGAPTNRQGRAPNVVDHDEGKGVRMAHAVDDIFVFASTKGISGPRQLFNEFLTNPNLKIRQGQFYREGMGWEGVLKLLPKNSRECLGGKKPPPDRTRAYRNTSGN